MLESKSRFAITKSKTAGSIGKSTTIISSDVDVVIFVNDKQPPFDDVLIEFEGILRNATRNELKSAVTDIRRNQCSLQFKVDHYDFDLLPATNFVHEANTGPDQQIRVQQQRTLDAIKRATQNRSMYSSSLAFSTVNFMKKQNSFAHDMVRLAKFWYESACITDYVYGAKYAMELIAIKASQVVKYNSENLHLAAFQKFLEDVKYFSSIDLVFHEEYDHLHGHQPPKNRSTPFILDPANPYNNLAEAFMKRPNAIEALKNHAERTLRNIRGLQFDDARANLFNFTFWQIIDIFKPVLFHVTHKVLLKNSFGSASKCYAPTVIRVDVSDETRKNIGFLQIYLTAICKKAPGNDPVEKLKLVYNTQFPYKYFVPATNEKHEDYNATISLKIDDGKVAVFSFDIAK